MKRKHSSDSSDSEYQEDSDASSSSSDVGAAIIAPAETFIQYLRGYLSANAQRVDAAYDSGAGWEHWLHVELFMYIKQQDANADIVREPSAYPGKNVGLRGDFLFQGATVEIKAETQSQTAAQFANGVGVDARKVENLNAAAVVLGVCLTQDSYDELRREVDITGSVVAAGVTIYYGYTASS